MAISRLYLACATKVLPLLSQWPANLDPNALTDCGDGRESRSHNLNVILSPHLVKRKISTVNSRDCTNGRCSMCYCQQRSFFRAGSHSQHQCEQLEKISMANYEGKCVCQFRDAPHLLLHVLQFPPARVLTHTTRTNQRCAKIVHYLVLLFSHTRDFVKSS